MIELGDEAKGVPDVFVDPDMAPGKVYVAAKEGGAVVSQLVDGKEVVLAAKGGSTELTTVATAPKEIEAPGTYVSQGDRDRLGQTADEPSLRLYQNKDGWKKVKSPSGVILLLTTALGLISAVFGLWLLLEGESGTSSTTVAERGEALLTWVTEPLGSGNDKEATQRAAEARRCLTALRGGEAKVKKVGEVDCTTSSPSFLKNNDSGGLLAAIVGLLTLVLGLVGVRKKFSFGSSPDS